MLLEGGEGEGGPAGDGEVDFRGGCDGGDGEAGFFFYCYLSPLRGPGRGGLRL